jgi:hypothetical protein
MRTDGSERQKLNDDQSFNIIVHDDWVYYVIRDVDRDDYDRRIFRMRTDGSERQNFSSVLPGLANVVGEWFFYTTGDGQGLYKVRIDGSERQRVGDSISGPINIVGDWIYYVVLGEEIFRIRTDGSDRQPVFPPTYESTPAPSVGAGNRYPSAQIGDIIQFGGHDWRVLEIRDGKALLLSDRTLFDRAFHSSQTNITWERSEMRAYLNGAFFNSFNSDDRELIVETVVITDANPWYEDTIGGNNTADWIFLLSVEEVILYLCSSEPTVYETLGPGEFVLETSDLDWWKIIALNTFGTESLWWLRSPGRYNNSAAYVSPWGQIILFGGEVDHFDVGVRPALWLDITN